MLKTFTRIVLIVLGLLLLLVVTVMLLLQTPLASTFAENRLRAWVHPAVQVNGPVQISVFPRLGMDLRDVTIPSKTAAHPAVSIKQLQWQVSWASLLEETLVLEQFYLQGLELMRSGSQWGTFVEDVEQAGLFGDGGVLDWVRADPSVDGAWQLSIRQALIEDVAVLDADAPTGQLPLASLGQLELKADVNWPAVAGSRASLGVRRLSVNDAEQFGHTPALLEQLGIAHEGAWDLMAVDSDWEVTQEMVDGRTDRILRLRSLSANGAWGQLTAAGGTIDLATGKMQIPVQTTLTNAPKFKSRALEINVRQSNMRFELTGTITEPGVRWLSQPRLSR